MDAKLHSILFLIVFNEDNGYVNESVQAATDVEDLIRNSEEQKEYVPITALPILGYISHEPN